MYVAARILAGIAGACLIVFVLDAAIRTFVLPRGVIVMLTRAIARAVRAVFGVVLRPADTYESRDRILALYAPISLLVIPATFLMGIYLGFAALFWACTGARAGVAMRYSGSALFTLGFATPTTSPPTLLVYAEAGIGLALLALLISYLPTMYAAFSRREVAVSRLSVRAGTPPSASDFLIRAHRAGFDQRLSELFEQWEVWFIELEETHTSFAFLTFFRSPNPNRSWVTASGTVLDTAALQISLVDAPYVAAGAVTIRSGFLALRAIATFFGIPFDPDPTPDGPISIDRDEFEAVADKLAAAGVPIKTDRDAAWIAFAGWRVNYDSVLLAIAGFIDAPYAEWSSDRSPVRAHHPPLRTPRRRDNR